MVGDWIRFADTDSVPERYRSLAVKVLDSHADGSIRVYLGDKQDCYDYWSKDGSAFVPIPITEELLLDNDFTCTRYVSYHMNCEPPVRHHAYSLLLKNGEKVATVDFAEGKLEEVELFVGGGHFLDKNTRYLHQLQHIFLFMQLCFTFKVR